MAATLLDDETLAEVMRRAGLTTKKDAVNACLGVAKA